MLIYTTIAMQIATSAPFYIPKLTVIPSGARDLLLIFTEVLKKVTERHQNTTFHVDFIR